MSRTTSRAAALTGLTATTVATGLLLAPGALAATLPAPTAPSTVTADWTFQVSGTDCIAHDAATADFNPYVILATDLGSLDSEQPEGLFLADMNEDGSWTADVFFPAGTTGQHAIYAACADGYSEMGVEYPEITVYVTPIAPEPRFPVTPPYTGPTPTSDIPLSALTGKVRGAQENTAGVASPDKGSATGDSAAPGRKVVKVLTGFKPGEVVTVTLHSTPQTVGTFTADQNGTVTVQFTVPAGTPTGDHTLVYEGNMGTYFQESLTVTAAAATSNASSSNLAYTGADVALPLGLGVGALALGGGLVFAARRRSAEGSQA